MTLVRDTPNRQQTSLGNQGAYYPQVVEAALDWIVMQLQEIQNELSLAIKVQPVDPALSLLPSAPRRANGTLGFDANGNPTVTVATLPTAGVSAAMAPVLQAPSTAQALADLGGQPILVAPFATVALLRANAQVPPALAWLQGYSTVADGGEGLFVYQPGDTTSADNGMTIFVDAEGHRYYRAVSSAVLDAKWFGVKGDGVTDDAAALNAAIAALPAAGGTIDCRSCGTMAVASTVTAGNGTIAAASTKNGVVLLGSGGAGPYGSAGTTLKWIGATGGAVIEFLGAMLGGGLQGSWTINCNGTAANGLIVNHLQGGQFGNITVENCTGRFVSLTTQTLPDPYGGCRNNSFGVIAIPAIPTGAVGLWMDGQTPNPGIILQNRFGVVEIVNIAENGVYGIYLGFADFNTFDVIDITGTTGGTSVGIMFAGQTAATVPFLNQFGLYANGMGESMLPGQRPWGNHIANYDYPDSGSRWPTVIGLTGVGTMALGGQNVASMSFGYKGMGWDTVTPALPAANTAVTNTNSYPVTVFLVPPVAGGTNVGITLTDQFGTANPLPPTNSVRLLPGAKITFTGTMPTGWEWYGDVF